MTMLEESEYIGSIDDIDEIIGRDAKIITVWSPCGGSGKTTIATSLAIQLQSCFDTFGYDRPVLILSVSEFDDIPAHGIGYGNILSKKSELDGKNIIGLSDVLNNVDTVSWETVGDCFVENGNGVYYLPSLTQRELLDAKTIPDINMYASVIREISSMFGVIIIDTPSIFYRDRGNLLNMAFDNADLICFTINASTKAMLGLFHFFDGIRDGAGRIPLDPRQCMLVVNGYSDSRNAPIGQLSYDNIISSLSRLFAYDVMVPETNRRASGGILENDDQNISIAIMELADTAMRAIDENDRIHD